MNNSYNLHSKGNAHWVCDVGARVESSAAISNDGLHLYIGDYDGKLNCIDCTNGNIVWTYLAGHQIKSSPYPFSFVFFHGYL